MRPQRRGSTGFGLGVLADALIEKVSGCFNRPGVILDLSQLKGQPGGFGVGGFFRFEGLDAITGRRRWVADAKNGVTLATLDNLLDTYLGAGTTVAAWYIGLIDNVGFTALSPSDTMASHSGWSEFTGYSGNRVVWSPGASSSQSKSNGTPASFTTTSAPAVIRGAFLCSDASSNAGTVKLFCTAQFVSGPQTLSTIGDVIKVTYICGAAPI